MKLKNLWPLMTTMMVNNEFLVKSASEMNPAEEVIEYAARLCYNSQDKLGTNQTFIQGLVRAGHLDVLEHASVSFSMDFTCENSKEVDSLLLVMYELIETYRYAEKLEIFTEVETYYPTTVRVILGANMRTWLEIVWDRVLHARPEFELFAYEIYGWLVAIAPNIFSPHINGIIESLGYAGDIDKNSNVSKRVVFGNIVKGHNKKRNLPSIVTKTGAIVTPLGYSSMLQYYAHNGHKQVSYLVSQASRAFSHQHVRHRKLSFSQLSQRYVDYTKQGDDFVCPDLSYVKDVDTADRLMNEAFASIVEQYQKLRNAGARKEDARAILPNAAKTSLVFSGYEDGINHYLALRTAKDAQYEIREIALAVETLYKETYL